jgi:hypothetical protein
MRSKVLTLLLAAGIAGSCSTTRAKEVELTRVAKDWCMTIRASQVLPVYPLTEDLEPGDVFLVRTSIDDQAEQYKEAGFLPFELHLARLRPEGYDKFYHNAGFGVVDGKLVPRNWQGPDDEAGARAWDSAPRATFPSYSFEVKGGGGLNLAIPVQGVPVGLSYLKSGSARGTVQLADAYTYGIGAASLLEDLRAWSEEEHLLLQPWAPSSADAPRNHLRIVTRVYLVGRVDILLLNDEASGARLDAGAPTDVTVPAVVEGDPTQSIDALNEALGQQRDLAPGGALQFTSASTRSVGLSETFPRPLVVGYLAIDLPIEANGSLGAPTPTQVMLRNGELLPATTTLYAADATTTRFRSWLYESGNVRTERLEQLRAWLATQSEPPLAVTNFLNGGQYASLRARAAIDLQVP